MKVKHFLFLFVAVSALFSSCYTDVTIIQPADTDYSHGIFVVNEGPWGGTGTISWYNPETGEVRDSLFEKANNGAVLGQFVQSLTVHNGKAYIVVNGANRVVIVNAATFQYLDTIGGLALPRYFLPVSQNVAYISQWGFDGISGSVAKVDLNTNQVLHTTPTGSGPEKMLFCADNHYLYVANSGGYGMDSTITAIAMDNNDQIANQRVITGQKNPACLTRTPGQDLKPEYVLCKGDWTDPNSQGWVGFGFVDPITGSSVPKGSDDLVTAPDGGKFFSSGAAIYAIQAGGTTSKLFDQPAYGFNIHPVTGAFYCADARDFSAAGEIVIRNPDGTVLGSFRTGVAPGEIVFIP